MKATRENERYLSAIPKGLAFSQKKLLVAAHYIL